MEAAKAFWHSTAMFTQQPHAMISRGRDRQFESVENAVRFVMEKLDPRDRPTAMIQTDSRSIYLADIEAIYTGLAPRSVLQRDGLEGYTTNSGTYVPPHQQTNPNTAQTDNYRTRGNVNPYTGVGGTRGARY